jgi:hypothetical protein
MPERSLPDIDPAIASYYDRAPEKDRLQRGSPLLEAMRVRFPWRTRRSTSPEELRAEAEAAGFLVLGLYGIEGPGWALPDFEARWVDPARRAALLHVARLLESEPSILGASAHLLVAGRKPEAGGAALGSRVE